MSKHFAVFVLSMLLTAWAQTQAETPTCPVQYNGKQIVFTGIAEAVDGDTLWIGVHKIRLYGIDAPEKYETCVLDGKKYPCFESALDEMKKIIGTAEIRCEVDRGNFGKPVMSYNRYLATCYVDGKDVARSLIWAGWALAEGDLYKLDEAGVKKQEKGLHGMKYIRSSKRDLQCVAKELKCTQP